ncbi:MAG: hypothetical protein HOV79_12000 [Hamadaea sp.]|nr:hypothetical protein [Hamadaea sp.]
MIPTPHTGLPLGPPTGSSRPPVRGPRPLVLLWVLLGAMPLLIAIGYAGGVSLARNANARDAARAAERAAHAPTSAALAPSSSPSPVPLPAPTWITSTRAPALRTVTAKPIFGTAYVARDTTSTAAFPGWPFAFRLPFGWNCVDGATLAAAPQAYRKVCVDEQAPDSRRAAVVSLLRCEKDCTASRLRATALSWLASAGTPERHDARTWYVVTPKDGDGLWVMDVAHVFTRGLRDYVAVVFVRVPPEDRELALKIANDVVGQAG